MKFSKRARAPEKQVMIGNQYAGVKILLVQHQKGDSLLHKAKVDTENKNLGYERQRREKK